MPDLKQPTKPRIASPRESVMDMQHAITELERAKAELEAVANINETAKHRRQALLVEPLGRLELVRRFVVQSLVRHGWSES